MSTKFGIVNTKTRISCICFCTLQICFMSGPLEQIVVLLENIGFVLSLLTSFSCYLQRSGKDKEAKML